MIELNSHIIEACAHAAHEVNRAYCIAIGDISQLPWDYALNWQKSSARKGIIKVFEGNTPEQLHESWVNEKSIDGWKYGSVKDPEKKEHPCMVPYEQLSSFQKMKDHLFYETVRSMAKSL